MSERVTETAVDLTVGGDDPVATLNAALDGTDLESDDVAQATLVVEKYADADDEQPDDDTDDDTDDGPTGVRANTTLHLVLCALDDAGVYWSDRDELADALGTTEQNNVSTALSKLSDRGLAYQRTGSRPYQYQITPAGEDLLAEIGRTTLGDAAPAWGRADDE